MRLEGKVAIVVGSSSGMGRATAELYAREGAKVVVTAHSNTRAGEEVNLSQPSVSVRIRQLQSELGIKLFEQLGKRVALTEAGKLLEPHARRVVAAVDNARHARPDILAGALNHHHRKVVAIHCFMSNIGGREILIDGELGQR